MNQRLNTQDQEFFMKQEVRLRRPNSLSHKKGAGDTAKSWFSQIPSNTGLLILFIIKSSSVCHDL